MKGNKQRVLYVRLSEEDAERIMAEAKARGLTAMAFMRLVIKDCLGRLDRGEKLSISL